ncbi:MAG: hypothetical protein ACI9TY_000616 [Alphaproteobacteria bacterium]|jgi:hypothetical protein
MLSGGYVIATKFVDHTHTDNKKSTIVMYMVTIITINQVGITAINKY